MNKAAVSFLGLPNEIIMIILEKADNITQSKLKARQLHSHSKDLIHNDLNFWNQFLAQKERKSKEDIKNQKPHPETIFWTKLNNLSVFFSQGNSFSKSKRLLDAAKEDPTYAVIFFHFPKFYKKIQQGNEMGAVSSSSTNNVWNNLNSLDCLPIENFLLNREKEIFEKIAQLHPKTQAIIQALNNQDTLGTQAHLLQNIACNDLIAARLILHTPQLYKILLQDQNSLYLDTIVQSHPDFIQVLRRNRDFKEYLDRKTTSLRHG